MNMERLDYHKILLEELANRKRLNPKYSLRDFAKHLQITPSHLCEILKGEKGLSKTTARKVAVSLGLGSRAGNHFRLLVMAKSGRSRKERNLAKQALKSLPYMPKANKELTQFLRGDAGHNLLEQ